MSRTLCGLLMLCARDFHATWHPGYTALLHYQAAATTFAQVDARGSVAPALTEAFGAQLAPAVYGPPADPLSTELFDAAGPQFHDVRQGHVGDCYLMASLASLAYAAPKLLMHNIRANPDGTSYTVTFFAPQGGDALVPVHVRVDDTLPMRRGGLAYADTVAGHDADFRADGKRLLWVALYEKAFSVFLSTYIDHRPSNYAALERPTFSYLAFGYLTGSYAQPMAVHAKRVEAAWQALNLANQGVPMTAGTRANIAPGSGLTAGHAYTVLQTFADARTGERTVLLRDPTGSHPTVSPPAAALSDGLLQIGLPDFVNNFARINVATAMAPARAYAARP